jgi:DNA topoisomerase-1
MPYNLVIVESPAKCQKIQHFLGDGWKVIASMGHIRALEETLDAVGIERDFEPKYTFLKTKAKALQQLKDMAKGASTVYLAADDDREGEAIAYSVAQYLKLNIATNPRAVFHEITEKAVKHAIEHPRTIDMNRVNAQQARSMLDMLIGFTISPLLWKHVPIGKALSAGRCQTPALRIVVEREKEIEEFKPSSSWRVSGQWTANQQQFYAKMTDEIDDDESAKNYLENMQHDKTSATITSSTVSPWKLSPPSPLITSTLQQQASALYHIAPKTTMSVAQKLYEAGYITYMRTDKAVLSEEAKKEARAKVVELFGEKYVGEDTQILKESTEKEKEKQEEKEKEKEKEAKKGKKEKETKKEKKGKESAEESEVKAQEAHEAIRPTDMNIQALHESSDTISRKIYNLIWQRTMQSVMADATGENARVHFEDSQEFHWLSEMKRTLFDGWKRIGTVAKLDENDEENEEEENGTNDKQNEKQRWNHMTSLKKGDNMQWHELNAEPSETRQPPRFTEATLVRELEKHGIGRPSTFASLLSAIQDKGYVHIQNIDGRTVELSKYKLSKNSAISEIKYTKKIGNEKQKLVPTPLGKQALSFLLQYFNDLFAYTFTAQMESRLDCIAHGNEMWKLVLKNTWDSYKERYTELKNRKPVKNTVDSAEKSTQNVVGTYEGNDIVRKYGRYGHYVECGDVRVSIKETDEIDEIQRKVADKIAQTTNPDAPDNAKMTNVIKKYKEYEVRNGPYGPYICKPSLKKMQFVSIPKELAEKKETLQSLTEADVDALYKAGLEKKKNAKKSPMAFAKSKSTTTIKTAKSAKSAKTTKKSESYVEA